MYTQPATILLYCCLSQQSFSGKFCILVIPTPHSLSLLHPLQPGFPPHHPHRNSSDQDQQLPPFFQSPLTTLTFILFILSALFGRAVHILLESCSALDYTHFPFLGFPSAVPDTPSQTCVGSASSTNLWMLPYPQDSSLNLSFLPKIWHAFLWSQIPSTHW